MTLDKPIRLRLYSRLSTVMTQLSITFPKHFALLSPDDLYEAASAEIFSALSEDRRIERKPPGIHSQHLASYFSMWANTVPEGGLIVVGIEDDGTISGCHALGTEQLNEIEKSPHRLCPDARVESKRVEVSTQDRASSFVILFRVRYREDKVVRTHANEAYVRYGDEKHKLTEPEIHELEIDKHQVDIEKEPVSLQYPDDFHVDLIHRFC
jgi:ATP-dependent DNA helicase RecG